MAKPKTINEKSLENLLDRSAPDKPGATKVIGIRVEIDDLDWLKELPEGVSYHARQAIRDYRYSFKKD